MSAFWDLGFDSGGSFSKDRCQRFSALTDLFQMDAFWSFGFDSSS
jgi:hypothetical protein